MRCMHRHMHANTRKKNTPGRVVHVVGFDLVEHLHHLLGGSLLLDLLRGCQTEDDDKVKAGAMSQTTPQCFPVHVFFTHSPSNKAAAPCSHGSTSARHEPPRT